MVRVQSQGRGEEEVGARGGRGRRSRRRRRRRRREKGGGFEEGDDNRHKQTAGKANTKEHDLSTAGSPLCSRVSLP